MAKQSVPQVDTGQTARDIENLGSTMDEVFGYLSTIFEAVGNLPLKEPKEKRSVEGLSRLGKYLCEDWANHLDCELEALAKTLKGGES